MEVDLAESSRLVSSGKARGLRVSNPAVTSTRVLASLWVATATGWGAMPSCTPSAPSTSYTPITGIQLPSAAIVAGHGCGTGGPDQVYKYAAIVGYAVEGGVAGGASGDGGVAITSGVFDCFADGLFSNLPGSDAGSFSFDVAIYAYNQCSFPLELACLQNAPTACPGDASVAESVASHPANWRATCTASEVAGVTAIAECTSLEPQDAAAQCVDAGTDAGTE
jgi:hypothetical protein